MNEYMDPDVSHLVLLGNYEGVVTQDGESVAVVYIGSGEYAFFDPRFDKVFELLRMPRSIDELTKLEKELHTNLPYSILDILFDARMLAPLGDPDADKDVKLLQGIAFVPLVEKDKFVPDAKGLPPALQEIFFPETNIDIPTVLSKHYDNPANFVDVTLQAVEFALRAKSGFLYRVPTPSGFHYGGLVSEPEDYAPVGEEDFVVLIGRYLGVDIEPSVSSEPKSLVVSGGQMFGFPEETDLVFQHLSVPRKIHQLPMWFEKNYPFSPIEFIDAITQQDLLREFTSDPDADNIASQFEDIVLTLTVMEMEDIFADENNEQETGYFALRPLPPQRELPESLLAIPNTLKGVLEPGSTDESGNHTGFVLPLDIAIFQEAKRLGITPEELASDLMFILPDILSSGTGYLQHYPKF